MRSRAFSLIELIVVIAIVGILAAIAIPSYKNYLTKAKLSGAMTVVEGYAEQSKVYYGKYGVFPDNVQVGVLAGFPANADGYLAKPYIPFMSFMGDGVATKCHFTVLTSYISNYSSGGEFFTNPNAPTILLKYYLVSVDGLIVTKCQAIEYVNELPTGGNPIPACDLDPNEFNTVTIVDSMCP